MKNSKDKRPAVIVIENNYIDMLVLRALLGKYVDLCIAPDLELAAKIISEFDFDIILLDVNSCTKEKDNSQLVKAQSKNKSIKVCALANKYGGPEVYVKDGFSEIFTKPVCKEDIYNALNWQVIKENSFLTSAQPFLRTLSSVF